MPGNSRGLLAGVLTLIIGTSSGLAQAESEAETESIAINGLEWALATNGDNIKWPEAVEVLRGTHAGRAQRLAPPDTG